MDSLTFISEIVKAVAWPVTIAFVVAIFRKDIRDLLPKLRKAKVIGNEFEFSELSQKEIEGASNQPKEPSDYRVLNNAYRALDTSPTFAVILAWQELENTAWQCYMDTFPNSEGSQLREPKTERNIPPSRLVDTLFYKKFFDEKHREIFHDLRRLRNQAAHNPSEEISDSDAKNYLTLAELLINQLKMKQDNNAMQPTR
ncbi:MAG: hypothetical protein MN733_27700 [Nitrososphaera sp.]|nr:hypothetical protein [Nitrososphaera sp.]